MTPRATALATVTAALAALIACSYYPPPLCPNGFWPMDGATSVDRDAVIEIFTGGALPADLPSLRRGLSLRSDRGPVDFEIEVVPDEGLVRLIPREPLAADTTFRVAGIDWWRLDEDNPHWWPARDFGLDYIEISFTTAREPALLGVLPDEEVMVAVFSEPVDLGSLEGRLVVEQPGRAHALTVLGRYEGHEHLVRVFDPALDLGPADIRLLDGALTADGLPIPAQEPVPWQGLRGPSPNLDRVTGGTWCAYDLWE